MCRQRRVDDLPGRYPCSSLDYTLALHLHETEIASDQGPFDHAVFTQPPGRARRGTVSGPNRSRYGGGSIFIVTVGISLGFTGLP
jgi:hypothetical protein